ncbi:hypothetical protein HPB51_029012 [Rhipicephalus microplus]|uniref:Uncharacterized protein n=1 Tax=Rhipicephalus microplus TaxID=6941 RepID=A0A9J6CVR6_RHIMP|nr:hypothetical protein HPB51_029012 [Rhipicephalus microplus]
MMQHVIPADPFPRADLLTRATPFRVFGPSGRIEFTGCGRFGFFGETDSGSPEGLTNTFGAHQVQEPAPLFRCPCGRHGRSQQRRLPRFSRLFLSGSSKRVAEFGDPHAEQCVAVGDSRSCSCIAGDSRVFQQRHRRLQQRG